MMADEPFSAMCGYDAALVGPAGVTQLACLHPLKGNHISSLHRWTEDRSRLGFAGELDLAGHDLFRWALDRTDAGSTRLDVGQVSFINHQALLALWTQQAGHTVIVEAASPMVQQVAAIVDLTSVRVEVVT